MPRYSVPIFGKSIEVEAESWQDAKRIVAESNPDATVGMPLRIGGSPEVPKKRPANSRFRMVDVDRMPDTKVGAQAPGKRKGRRRR